MKHDKNIELTKHDLVMLVDDSAIDNFVSQKTMVNNNFAENVLEFLSARTALDYLLEQGLTGNESAIPSLICLDMNMPVMNGFGFMEEFEKLPEMVREKSHVVILTSMYNPEILSLTFKNSNIINFISKPLIRLNLETIELTLRKKQENRLMNDLSLEILVQ